NGQRCCETDTSLPLFYRAGTAYLIPGALSFNFVPGLIGRLTANLRLPIGQISTPGAGLPVIIDVVFRILGPDGSLLSGVTTRFETGPTRGPVVATDPGNPFVPLTAIIPVPLYA